jgi:hypothetical protein
MITDGSGCCPFLNDIPFVEGIHKAIFVNFRKLTNDPDWDSRQFTSQVGWFTELLGASAACKNSVVDLLIMDDHG